MSKIYTYNSWVDTFKPVSNKITNELDSITFETYGEELEHVRHTDINHVWTEVDGDDGTYILAGYRLVNRIQYYITENPWSDEHTEVPTWVYRQCDCIDEETNGILAYNGEYNPDCPECDEGMIDIPTDTVADLIEIYGEATNIVS
jgi:hypothetical protein